MEASKRKEFRRKVGAAVIQVQNLEMEAGTPVTVVIPELVAALMSLASYIACKNGGLTKRDYMKAARMAADEQWF